MQRTHWLVLLAAVYLTSFLLPVESASGNAQTYGYQLFLLGAWGTATVAWLPWTWPWLANVAFWVGWVRLARGRPAGSTGFWAAALALGYLPYAGWDRMPLGIGYFLWAGSMVLLARAGSGMVPCPSRAMRGSDERPLSQH